MKIKAVNVENVGTESPIITTIEPVAPIVPQEPQKPNPPQEPQGIVVPVEPVEPQEPVEHPSDVSITDEMWNDYLKEKHGVASFDDLKTKITEENKPNETQNNLPPDVDSFLKWKKENIGGTMSEYVTVTKDWSGVSDGEVINTYMRLKKPHLSQTELDFEINRMFSVDEEVDSNSEVMAKQIAKKDFLEGAKSYFKEASDNFKPSRLDDLEIPQEYKDALSKYKEMKETSDLQTSAFDKQRNLFKTQTDKYFSEEFKGFEFKVGENESKVYMPSDLDTLKDSNLDITNMLGKYVNQDGSIKDTGAYHRAISIASDPEGFAKFFYEQGKSDGVEDVTSSAKNKVITPRTALSPEGQTSKIRQVSIGASDYKFKLKQ